MESNTAGQYQSWQPRPFDDNDPGAPPPSTEEEAPRRDFIAIAGAKAQEDEPGAGFESNARPASSVETDFASIKFQRETTLLTNAEEYATSIRREAELY